MVSSAYLRLLIFHLEILIPACASSSPVFLMICSAYKLNKQDGGVGEMKFSRQLMKLVDKCMGISTSVFG